MSDMIHKKALLIIDIQNDYFEGGAFPLVGTEQAAQKAAVILDHFRKKHEEIIHVQHISTDSRSVFFLPNTSGVEINSPVKPQDGEKLIVKHYPNSFRETELLDYLKFQNINQLIICGMMTNMCVDATVRAAKDLGFECTVIGDACAAANLQYDHKMVNGEDVHASFLAALSYFYADVISADEYVKR